MCEKWLWKGFWAVKRGDRVPLKAYVDRSAFKLYFLDVGLFRCLANIPPEITFHPSGVFEEFNGLMAEQFVLQEFAQKELFYWTNDATAEVDFVGQFGREIVPIEVKSGENVYAKSLRLYREKYQPRLAVRMSLKGLEENDGLLNIPLYESFLAKRLIELALSSTRTSLFPQHHTAHRVG